MIQAATPIDEVERLADLRATHLLDTPNEDRFDRIVHLAAHVLNAPIAYIALVDADRQWFKARCGIATVLTPREISFCSHAVLQAEPLIVADTTRDARFADNPMVVGEPFIRFYAGHPLRGPKGHNIGTLCIADTRPRDLADHELHTLRKLAQLAEHELNLVGVIEAQQRLLKTQEQLLHAQQRLTSELREAVSFVRSLLPARLLEGPVLTDWLFLASEQLGGDTFGYHWLNDRQMAMYIVDVTGHGVGAALLSVSVHNALRTHTLPETDFEHPETVLSALNRAFPMDANGGKFSTVWYGVFDLSTRLLRYGSAGHPPAILLNSQPAHNALLGQPNFMIGVMAETTFATNIIEVPPASSIYLYSDGASEATRLADGAILGTAGLAELIDTHHRASAPHAPAQPPIPRLPQILESLQAWRSSPTFDDDVTLVEIDLP